MWSDNKGKGEAFRTAQLRLRGYLEAPKITSVPDWKGSIQRREDAASEADERVRQEMLDLERQW